MPPIASSQTTARRVPKRPGRRVAVRLRRLPSTVAPAALALFAAVVLLDAGQLDALQRMAGYTTGKTFFAEAQQYLDNLRDSLIPLAIPIGAIGLTGGGVAYMVGNVMAQKILGGVVIGLALTLMGPSIVA
jgi:hypothetical protein